MSGVQHLYKRSINLNIMWCSSRSFYQIYMVLSIQTKVKRSYNIYQIQESSGFFFFNSKFIIVYTDGGTKYRGLHTSAINLGIQHLIFPPYTLKIVGPVECHHCHIVETGLTLFHQASLLLTFWPNDF